MRRSALVLVVVGCGAPAAVPIDASPDAELGCAVRFSGNFDEVSVADANCPTLAPALRFAIPSQALAASLNVTIDLGGALPGHYSSETVASWTAIALERIADGGCQYSAGAKLVPSGSFTLDLTAVDGPRPHGTLELLQYVLTLPGTDCGDFDTEQVDLEF